MIMNSKKILKIIIAVLILIVLISIVVILISIKENNNSTVLEKADGITVVPTMNDTITTDSSWCGTFQLVWNDMKNELVKKDIKFNPQLDIIENLNKEDFNKSMISEDYYFKIYGEKNLSLKTKIEKGIQSKFNQSSDILEKFDWSEKALSNDKTRKYLFYTMLYRKFDFLQEFDKLDNGKFANKYNDIKYFGIDKNTKDSVGNQITVLYYNSKDDFAILINTKTNDEIILCKNPKGSSFNEIYDNMNNESNKYEGSKAFYAKDEFKAPNITFDEEREFTELEHKEFKDANNLVLEIEKALQTIKFSIDEKGGKIKSEAGIVATYKSVETKEDKARYFYLDDTFAIFLREKGKSKPYFAGRIENITKFQ